MSPEPAAAGSTAPVDVRADATPGAVADLGKLASGVTERAGDTIATTTGPVSNPGALVTGMVTSTTEPITGTLAAVTTSVSGSADSLLASSSAVTRPVWDLAGPLIEPVAEGPVPVGPLPIEVAVPVPDNGAPSYRGPPATSAPGRDQGRAPAVTAVGDPPAASLLASGEKTVCGAAAIPPAESRSGQGSGTAPWSPPLPAAPFGAALSSFVGFGNGQLLSGLTAVTAETWRPELDSGRLAPAGHRWSTGRGVRPGHPSG